MAAAPKPIAESFDPCEDNPEMPDYVRMLLFNEKRNAVLMLRDENHHWQLPYFVYPQSLNYCVYRCCDDLSKALSVLSSPEENDFTVMVELYGENVTCGKDDDDDYGFSRLMLIESHVDQLQLPSNSDWKDSNFISSLLEDPSLSEDSRSNLEDVFGYITGEESLMVTCVDQRYQYGWYDRAASWFLSEVSKVEEGCSKGRVIQEQVIATSTVMRFDTSKGAFYLKAPALGLKEISITAKIASIFPEYSPEIIATSSCINSFITTGFHNVYIDDSHYGDMVNVLAHFQIESLNFVEELKEAGCEVRSPMKMAKKLQSWAEDKDIEQILQCLFPKYKTFVPKFVELLARLDTFNLPLTLVHGDFSEGNVAFKTRKEEELILFDWQYACIAHPFLDLHEVTIYNDFPEDVINNYLDLWSEYESRERAREAFEIARVLGWTLKMWTSIDCSKRCNPQRVSTLDDIVQDAFKVMVSEIENPKAVALYTS